MAIKPEGGGGRGKALMARPLREELFFCCFPLSICWNDSRKGRRKEGIKTKKRKEKEMRKKGIEE